MPVPQPDNTLGGRLALLSPDDLTRKQSKLYDQLQATLVQWADRSGFQAQTAAKQLIGPFNAMLRSPLVSQGMLEFLHAETEHTTLSERVRQVIILSVGAVWHSAYELYAHTAVARQAGLDLATIAALAAGECPGSLAKEERVAQQFTHLLATEHRVDEQTYQQALDAFGEEGVVNLVYLAGNYLTTCALLNVFAVPAPK